MDKCGENPSHFRAPCGPRGLPTGQSGGFIVSLPRVLVVEDDASIRRFVAMALEDEPIRLLQAATLAEATHALAGAPLALVICDLMLPDGSGLDFLRDLAQPGSRQSSAVRVVFSAGLSADVRRQLLEQAGVFEVLGKPVALAELQRCTREALQRFAAQTATAPDSPSAARPQPPGDPGLLYRAPAPATVPGVADDVADAVARYFGGDHQRYAAFNARCCVQFSTDLMQGEQALCEGDLATLHRLTHSLKSVMQNLGHGAASGLAARLELAAQRGQRAESEQLWQPLAQWLRARATG